jgi:hypothetical protein
MVDPSCSACSRHRSTILSRSAVAPGFGSVALATSLLLVRSSSCLVAVSRDGNICCVGAPVLVAGAGRCRRSWARCGCSTCNQDQIKNLATYGYHPVKRTPGLWKHETRRTTFTLVVNNFGVQYFNKEDADHLINSIEANYPVKTDWTGSKYIGINLDWDYTKREVKLSMEGYVKNVKALKEYQHKAPPKAYDAPTKYHKLESGQKIQYERTDESKPLTPKQTKTIQKASSE